MTEEISSEFQKYLKENVDCPDKIFKMAKTPWQKAVAVEFFKNQEDRNLIKKGQDHIEYLIKLILGVTAAIGVAFIVEKALSFILSI